ISAMIRGKSRISKFLVAAFASYVILTLLLSDSGGQYWKKNWVDMARSTLEDRALEHIGNETLGFEHIYAIGLKERTDKRDFLTLAASMAGFRVEWVDGVRPDEFSEKAAANIMQDNLLKPSEIGCWRAHMNALHNMIQNSYSSALILEDDADWDITIKQQLREFARGIRALTGNTNTSKTAPYGTNWDILWIGGCASAAAPNETQFYAIPNDPTAPSLDHRGTWGGPLESWKELYPETSTRFIYRAEMGCCTYGYAVTKRGAERILAALAVDRLVAAVDNSMADMCGGKDGRPQIECYAPFPNMIGTYKAAGLASKDSDIHNGSEDEWHEAQAWNLMYSTRLNIHRLVAGEDTVLAQYDEGFPWSRRVLSRKAFEYPRGYLVT
ncbi:LPS glycosyltransferase, partial [Aspergillus sclerotiicarbonarius CBS 121057]